MNLQELAKKHILKVGDKVLCTYSNFNLLHTGEHSIAYNCVTRSWFIREKGGSIYPCELCTFELPKEKKRHIHADLINWWAECPSENDIQVKAFDSLSGWVTLPNPEWNIHTEYRKKPTATELKIEKLFDLSIDDLHGIAICINELKRTNNV